MKRLTNLALVANVALGTPMAATQAANLKLLTSWNRDNWPTYAALEQYVKNVDGIGGG